jgi:hypothetical protein
MFKKYQITLVVVSLNVETQDMSQKRPLFVYGDENNLVGRVARNIPDIEICNVHRLNLL